MMIGALDMIVIDTPDPKGLSAFYGELAGLSTVEVDDNWGVFTRTPEGWAIGFQSAPDLVSPRWPDPAHPQQMHLDFVTADRLGAVAMAVKLGATRLPGGGDTYTVLADPSGHPFCVCHRDGVAGVGLAGVSLDCPDGAGLARFYAGLLGMEVAYEGAEGAMLAAEGQPAVMFQNVATYNPPRWPDPAYPQQYHLDVKVPDVEAAEPAVLALGATRLPGGGNSFRVFADPIGHPLCLIW